MCGIIGFIGFVCCYSYLLNGLKQLQNRGYDSAGICSIDKDKFIINKYASSINKSALDKLQSDDIYHQNNNIGISHTRWATHGAKTDFNSHPHIDCFGLFSLVHNGIIENYLYLKDMLINKGYTFISQTDTEVIVNLISYNYKQLNNVVEAIMMSLASLDGTYALCILFKNDPDTIYCVRKGSPLLVGIMNDYAIITSESSGFCGQVNNYICLDNEDLCIIHKSIENNIKKITMKSHNNYIPKKLEIYNDNLSPFPYDYWTLKEIYEQPDALLRTLGLGGRVADDFNVKLGGLDKIKDDLIQIDNIILLGCGTSYYSALCGSFFLKDLCNFNTVQVFDGAEFDEKDIPKIGKTALFLLSQSGETRDLIKCLKLGKDKNLLSVGIINVVDSLIAREVSCGVYLNAGREFAVASTKSFTSQVVVLAMVSIWFAQNNSINHNKRKDLINSIRRLSYDINTTIEMTKTKIKELAKYLSDKNNIFLLGKGICEYYAKEGALKIKEIGYIHAEGYNSSALKHGPYSLIVPETPTIIICPDDQNFSKNISTMEEISSRYGYIIGISDKDLSMYKFNTTIQIPYNQYFTGLLAVVTLQLLAFELALTKGHDPDVPRNLAKVVTVD